MGIDYFKYLTQESDSKILDLVKHKDFSLWVYEWSQKVTEELLSKEKFYSSLTSKMFTGRECEHVFKINGYIWNKDDERLSRLLLKIWCYFVSLCVWKI